MGSHLVKGGQGECLNDIWKLKIPFSLPKIHMVEVKTLREGIEITEHTTLPSLSLSLCSLFSFHLSFSYCHYYFRCCVRGWIEGHELNFFHCHFDTAKRHSLRNIHSYFTITCSKAKRVNLCPNTKFILIYFNHLLNAPLSNFIYARNHSRTEQKMEKGERTAGEQKGKRNTETFPRTHCFGSE